MEIWIPDDCKSVVVEMFKVLRKEAKMESVAGNNVVCAGQFHGGEVEPGVFHGGESEPGQFHGEE